MLRKSFSLSPDSFGFNPAFGGLLAMARQFG